MDPYGNKMIIKNKEKQVLCNDRRGTNTTVGIFPGIKFNASKSDDAIVCSVEYQFKDKKGNKRRARLKPNLNTKVSFGDIPLQTCAIQQSGKKIEFPNEDALICQIANKYGKVKAAIKEAQEWDGGSFQGLGREQQSF